MPSTDNDIGQVRLAISQLLCSSLYYLGDFLGPGPGDPEDVGLQAHQLLGEMAGYAELQTGQAM